MQFILPPTIALKTVYPGNCLNYCNDSDSETHGCLKFNGVNAFSSLAKFEVVPANTGTGLVHIKCSHNKKFLRRLREGDVYLSPEADDPEERDNKWWCTLFKPQVAEDGNPNNARLFHVEGQRWAAAYNEEVEGEKKTFLRLCRDNEGGTVFRIVDWESLVVLPPTIALKSSFYGDYLNYSDDSDSKTHGFLKFNGANVFSSFAKFEVVPANTGKGLVHIRCSQNRKFLQSRAAYISPEAEKQEEDQFKSSCTLFRLQLAEDGNPDRARLFHVQSKQYAAACDEGGGENRKFLRLYEHDHEIDDRNIINITDLESLVILPKHVAFKGHTGNYLELVDWCELYFQSTDKSKPESWFEVFTDGHGRVQIKSYCDTNLYFCYGAGLIWCNNVDDAATDPSTLFWPVKVDSKTFALKSLVNNEFCAQIVDDYGRESLKAAYTSITTKSRFALEDLVLSRKIYNTEFDLKKAIVYGETPVTMTTINTSNNTSSENPVEFKFAYKESKSSTWKASHSWIVGIEVTGSFKIPFIGDTGVTLKGEYSGSYEWGKTVTEESTLETTYKVTVLANTSVSVSLIATKGTCDVPYSYYQKDVLYNGKTVVYKKDDGLYTGDNSYKFSYVVTSRKEPKSIADLPIREQKLPDPSVDPFIQQNIPIPVPYGSITRV